MAMELEFWEADGLHGEVLSTAVRVQAWEILKTVERYKTIYHVYIILRHTMASRGEWIIWVREGYTSGTYPEIGPLNSSRRPPARTEKNLT